MKTFSIQASNDRKHHIGISNYAFHVIQEDYSLLHLEENGISWNTFLNQIIESFMDQQIPPCNINSNFESYWQAVLDGCKNSISEDTLDDMRDTFAKNYIANVQNEWSFSLDDRVSRSFNLKDDVCYKLADLSGTLEAELFSRPGKYTNAIFEAYAHKTFLERESIVCHDQFHLIKIAIRKKRIISFLHTNGCRYSYIPYKLQADRLGNYYFVAGMVLSSSGEHDYQEDRETPYPAAFRISRIGHIYMDQRKTYRFSKEETKYLDELILKNGIEFIVQDTFAATVRYTSAGWKKSQNQIYRKPIQTKVISDKNRTYVYEGTFYQMASYFFQFGKDAEILEPKELRDHLAQEYATAAEIYANSR